MDDKTIRRKQQLRAAAEKRSAEKVMLRVWMDPAEMDRLRAAAAAEGITMSEYIRRQIPPAK